MSVGSANTSNRSMGLDTELNVSWEAPRPNAEVNATVRQNDHALRASIQAVRVDLLAEHCGLMSDAAARRELARSRGIVDHLDALAATRKHKLRPLTRAAILADREWVETLQWLGFSFDPGSAALEETLHEGLRPVSHSWLSRLLVRLYDWWTGRRVKAAKRAQQRATKK